MKGKFLFSLIAVLLLTTLLFSACAPANEQAAVDNTAVEEPANEEAVVEEPENEEAVVEEPAVEEAVVEETCLIIGALYGGPITDAGYNQAMHESVMQIKENKIGRAHV